MTPAFCVPSVRSLHHFDASNAEVLHNMHEIKNARFFSQKKVQKIDVLNKHLEQIRLEPWRYAWEGAALSSGPGGQDAI
jgi:hypothetical protein